MHAIADAAATLGSRFNLIFVPGDRRVYHGGYGKFKEQHLDLNAGIRTPEGEAWSLPFTRTVPVLQRQEHFSTLTTLEYRAVHPDSNLRVSLKLRAPFYPQDAQLSTAPFFFVDLTVKRTRSAGAREDESLSRQGYLVFDLQGDGISFKSHDAELSYWFESTSQVQSENLGNPEAGKTKTCPVQGWLKATDDASPTERGFEKRYDLLPGESCTMKLLWWGWAPEAVMEIAGEQAPFKYQQFFKTPEAVAQWALRNRDNIEAKCDFLDRTVEGWSLGVATSNLAALGLHAFLANTWWGTGTRGDDWFAVTDGARACHSPVSVEYSNALFYLSLWPQLLGMLLRQWENYERDADEELETSASEAAYLARDMGSQFCAGEPCSHHPTPVESNADYLLLTAAHVAWGGKASAARQKLPLCRRLAEFIFKCDTTGNGLPDRCTANMLEDGSAPLQYGRDQVYLALKAQAALTALAEIEEACDPANSRAERWRAFVAKGVKTLDTDGWLGDHYPVTLPTEAGDGENPWTGESLPGSKLKGWDDYSIHTANGFLYLGLANLRQPHWRTKRLAKDLENAERRCRTAYGATHTATCDTSVWFSRNICKDFVAAYLGIDLLNNAERYWDYQVVVGGTEGGTLFCDSTLSNDRCYHPGGVAIVSAPLAAAGFRLNRLEGELFISPVRTTLDVPLLPFADWERRRVPWLRVRQQEGVATARISNRDLIEGLTLETVGVELEKT